MKICIIGQGVAGSSLAMTLLSRGLAPRDLMVIDSGATYGSTAVSSGIINPLVFKRMTLSWGSDLVAEAWKFYARLEQGLGSRLIHRAPMFRPVAMGDRKISDTPDMADYFEALAGQLASSDAARVFFPASPAPLSEQKALIEDVRGGELVQLCGWIDGAKLVQVVAGHLTNLGVLEHSTASAAQLKQLQNDGWAIVLCTGIQHRFTALSQNLPDALLPFYPVKGDIVTLKIPAERLAAFPPGSIINRKIAVKLLDDSGIIEAGSSYIRDFTSPDSDFLPAATGGSLPEGVRWIMSQLEALGLVAGLGLARKEIIEVRSGIRPASRDRLAYLGALDDSGKLYSFNGLGTRGFMLAPGLAGILADHLFDGRQLPEELDPRRTLSPGSR